MLCGVVLLLGALYLLGVVWGDDDPSEEAPLGRVDRHADRHRDAGEDREAEEEEEGGADARVTLRLTATRRACTCASVDATGKAVVNGEYLETGQEHQDVPLAALPDELRQRRR